MITYLSVTGMDPTPLIRKDHEVLIATQMKEKYNITRYGKGFMIFVGHFSPLV